MFVTAINSEAGESRCFRILNLHPVSSGPVLSCEPSFPSGFLRGWSLRPSRCRTQYSPGWPRLHGPSASAGVTDVPDQLGLQMCQSSFPLGFVSSGIFTYCLLVFCSEKSRLSPSGRPLCTVLWSRWTLSYLAHGVCHDPHLFRMPDSAVWCCSLEAVLG